MARRAARAAGMARSLAVDGLGFSFPAGPAVLEDFTVHVPGGSVLALLGSSGCGKTTALRLIAGLESPETGSVTVGGTVLSAAGTHVPPEKRRVGMVFQDWALFPHLDAAANIAFGLPRALRKDPAAVEPTLELVGLDGLGSRLPSELSGGQQQRVALGRALAQEPDVLLLDEPFSNLDTSLRARVRSDVHRLLREIGITTVMVTHDRDEAFVLGDSVALMRDGRIVQQGAPAEVYGDPTDEWCARFVGDVNVVPGDAAGGVAATVFGALELTHERAGAVSVLLRPEQLELIAPDARTRSHKGPTEQRQSEVALSDSGSSDAGPVVPSHGGRRSTGRRPPGAPAVVSLVEYHGPRTHYVVELDDLSLRVESVGEPTCAVGDTVVLCVRPGQFPALNR